MKIEIIRLNDNYAEIRHDIDGAITHSAYERKDIDRLKKDEEKKVVNAILAFWEIEPEKKKKKVVEY